MKSRPRPAPACRIRPAQAPTGPTCFWVEARVRMVVARCLRRDGARRRASAGTASHLHFWPMTLAGVVWHYWIAVPLAAAGIVSVLAAVAGYLQKVTYKRYPRD